MVFPTRRRRGQHVRHPAGRTDRAIHLRRPERHRPKLPTVQPLFQSVPEPSGQLRRKSGEHHRRRRHDRDPGAAPLRRDSGPGLGWRAGRKQGTWLGRRQGEHGVEDRRLQLVASGLLGAGTPLLTPDGSKAIERIRVGDEVLSRPEGRPDHLVAPMRVEEVFEQVAPRSELRRRLCHQDHGGAPVYARDKGWTAARDLLPGDQLSTHERAWVPVESARDLDSVATV